MATTKADFQDAMDIGSGIITVKGDNWGYVTGLTLDGKSPEDLINCIGGTLRRRRPENVEWSVDAAVLYDNITNLQALKDGVKFNIEVSFVNPDTSDSENLGQKIIIRDCTVQDLSINLTESSTFRMSGRAKKWEVTPGYTGS